MRLDYIFFNLSQHVISFSLPTICLVGQFLLLVGLWLKWHLWRNVSEHFFVFDENFSCELSLLDLHQKIVLGLQISIDH